MEDNLFPGDYRDIWINQAMHGHHQLTTTYTEKQVVILLHRGEAFITGCENNTNHGPKVLLIEKAVVNHKAILLRGGCARRLTEFNHQQNILNDPTLVLD